MKPIDHVEAAVRATTFVGAHSFAWFGKRPASLRPSVRRGLSAEALQQHLAATLRDRLYRSFYCPGYAQPIRWVNAGQAAAGDFVSRLSAANMGAGSWSTGWLVRSVSDPRVVVAKDGLCITTFIQETRRQRTGLPEPGEVVDLPVPKELVGVSPGFMVVVGNTPDLGRHGPLVRLYWNIAAAGASELVLHVSRRLADADVPFRLKLLNHPARYHRCDAGVLYVDRADYEAIRADLEAVYRAVRGHLGNLTPVFTLALAPGLGLAEDPGGGESFGLQRCGLLAQGLLAARAAGKTSTADRRDEVLKVFAEAGVSLECPHLNPGSREVYPFDPAPAAQEDSGEQDGEGAINAERAIGVITDYLCRNAIWHEDRCTWIAASERNPEIPSLATLGCELYSGLSGIALVLAEAGHRMGNADAVRVARGALRQAHHMLDAVPPDQRAGLYTGWTGVALASRHVGQRLDCDELLGNAHRLTRSVATALTVADGNDLLSGWAGAIVGALQLAKGRCADEQLASAAIHLGDRLIRCADRRREGASWRTINRVGEYNLTGFSHGTAGIAYALLALFEAFGEARFRTMACDALAYEQHWFDPVQGNWPDLREARPQRIRRPAAMDYSTYWCHGAPGIALSRIAAYRVTRDGSYLEQARVALNSTLKSLVPPRNPTLNDLVLCHGMIGNADILLTAERELGSAAAMPPTTARQLVGASGAALNASLARCPSSDGGSISHQPGLMTGLAGAAWFHLRLLDKTVPSVLKGIALDETIPT